MTSPKKTYDVTVEELYSRYNQPLTNRIYNLTQDLDSAEDIMQLTWEKILVIASKKNGISQPSLTKGTSHASKHSGSLKIRIDPAKAGEYTLVYSCAVRNAIDYFRKQKRSKEENGVETLEMLEEKKPQLIGEL